MTFLERFARIEHATRPMLTRLPPAIATRLFTAGRTRFAHLLEKEDPTLRELRSAPVTAWNLTFQLPLWNAAGMFKDGGGYSVMARQGAGAYVAGTTTSMPRKGNTRNGIQWPAVPYPHSGSASNWMGLPNPGHTVVATRLARMPRVAGVPVGASVSTDPGLPMEEAMNGLLSGLTAYSLAKADYLEINESCPNVPHAHTGAIDDELIKRLEIISERFLHARHRPLPVVVKFSNDLDPTQLPALLQVLVQLRYDGIILGNTSTRYREHRQSIAGGDRKLYDMFTTTFGGGLSGAVVRHSSLTLTSLATEILRTMAPAHEFHVIRCGGIADASDLLTSMNNGVLLHQWYTGYYEAFSRHGHNVYQRLSESIAALRKESNRTVTLS